MYGMKIGKISPPSRTVAQPISHVLRLKRGKFAEGGDAEGDDSAERWHVGSIRSPVKGRTDHIPLTVPPGAFVIPADIVSAMGQGNSEAGHLQLAKTLGLSEHTPKYAKGGGVKIMAAGGEHVIAPSDVRRLGKGDLKKGHERLDKFVVAERAKLVKTLKKLPPPVKNG